VSDEARAITEQLPRPALPPVKGHPILAWIVIALCIAFILYRHIVTETAARARFGSVVLELQARYIVGVADLLGQRNEMMLKQAEAIAGHGYDERLRFAVLAGELAGPDEALSQLRDLPVDEGETEITDALERIYRAQNEGPPQPPPSADVALVREKLGWFGELATAPPGSADTEARAAALRPARRTAEVILSVTGLFILATATGFFVLLTVTLLAATGKMPPRLVTGSPYGNVYAETFAAWMALFLGLSFVMSLVPWQSSRLLATGILVLASLSVLIWPLARGVPWFVLRYDIGLGTGRRPGVELIAGFGTYAAALPFLAAGALAVVVLAALAKQVGHPQEILGHPIVRDIVQSDWWGRFQVFLVASVVAPIVEETMFRGVLYRHLRESTSRAGRPASVGLSALAVSFVFAVIHPQGWFGVPPLMGLAFVFCLAREWRGTLIAPMVAHAIQNTIITVLVILAAG
jgi:membrane protease YdiL (CAAX protease family)